MSQEPHKSNVGSDATNGSHVRFWQRGPYVFALALTGCLIVVNVVWIARGNFSVPGMLAALVLGGVTWTILTASSPDFVEPVGAKIGLIEPDIQFLVEKVATEMNAPLPGEIYLVADAEITRSESTRFLGLRVERSVLRIGMPFLQALTRQELAALIALELAPHGQTTVAHGARAVRALRAARDLIADERNGFVNGVYGSYARKMFRDIGGVGVAQEEAAERAAIAAYGSDAMISALRKYDDTVVAFDQMLRDYVVPALQHHAHPSEMFTGFGELLRSTSRAQSRASDVERRQATSRCEFDLHRLPAERVVAWADNDAITGRVVVRCGQQPAHTLLDRSAESSEIVTRSWANKLMTNHTEPQSWQQLADEIYSVKTRNIASKPFAAGSEAGPHAHFEEALSWAEAGNWHAVDGALATERRAEWMRCVVTEAAAAEDVFCWKHSWDGPPVLVDSTGSFFDAEWIASLMVDGKADEARAAFAEEVSCRQAE